MQVGSNENIIHNPFRMMGRSKPVKKIVQSRSGPAQRTISTQRAQGGRVKNRGRSRSSIPGEYSRHHLVHGTEGSAELVVLFVIAVDIHGVDLRRWTPTLFFLFFSIIAFDVFSDPSLVVIVLDCLSVLLKKHPMNQFNSLFLFPEVGCHHARVYQFGPQWQPPTTAPSSLHSV